VNNVNVTVIHNVYETRVTNVNVTRVSYNGPNGGINERPRADEEAAARQRHLPAVPVQHQHIQAARSNRELRASENRGKPPIAATQRPGTLLAERWCRRKKEAGTIRRQIAVEGMKTGRGTIEPTGE